MAIAEDQKLRIIALLREGALRNDQIAVEVGVSVGTVNAIRAHLTMGSYDRQVNAITSESGLDQIIEAEETIFGLERDLQLALRANIHQLEAGLEIIDGGKEQTTDAGRIDITARDSTGKTVVIELKAGNAAPEAFTQILAYMGAVQQKEGMAVRGILIAGDFHQRVIFAAQAAPNVLLRRYRFKFTFEGV